MIPVDVFSGYIVCGAGSLVGAAMMSLAPPDEPRLRDALRAIGQAFLLLGVSLVAVAADSMPLSARTELLCTAGPLLSMVLFARGFAMLHGERVRPGVALAAAAVAVATMLLAHRAGPAAFSNTFCVLATVLSLWITWHLRHFVTRPRNVAEAVMGWCIALYAATWGVRSVLTLLHDGPREAHLMDVPPALQPVFAAFYGVLPMLVATLVLNVVNARLRDRLRALAMTDALTGAMTRRALTDLAPGAIAVSRSRRRGVAVLMIDLDHFKAINDRHGHPAGDRVLRHAAATLRAQLRADALLARYGGEEFAVVLHVDDPMTAAVVAERLRHAVAHTPFEDGAPEPIGLSVSIGAAMLGDDEPLESALARADEALYRAKDEGRNRVVMAADDAAAAAPRATAGPDAPASGRWSGSPSS